MGFLKECYYSKFIHSIILNFNRENTSSKFQNVSTKRNTTVIIIGDCAFVEENKFKYIYDLSEEWFNFTRLPLYLRFEGQIKSFRNDKWAGLITLMELSLKLELVELK